MGKAFVEHVNVTVRDAEHTAKQFCEIFGWHIRWQGSSIYGGKSVHVGAEDSYLALYQHDAVKDPDEDNYHTLNGLNHIGVVVDNLDATEEKILALGYKTKSHADYEPGRRFYFDNDDGIEIEVVSYTG